MIRLAHIDPKQNVANRYPAMIGETPTHYLVQIVYANGPPGSIVHAVSKQDYYVVVEEKKGKKKETFDDLL